MLRFLNQCSQGRGAWLLMAFTALALELTALWFQHVMLLKPCVLCIYERCALFGVLGAALIGAMITFFRFKRLGNHHQHRDNQVSDKNTEQPLRHFQT